MLWTRTPIRSGAYLSLSLLGMAAAAPRIAQAKTPGLIAIEIYPASTGSGYVQISDLVLDGKNEVSVCPASGAIDRNTYHKLQKIRLAPGMKLERDSRGVLMLTSGGSPTCVVPANLKLDKGDSLTVATLGGRAAIEGKVLPGSDPVAVQPPALKPGAALYIVTAPNQEMAEYLRAKTTDSVQVWSSYLSKYGASADAPAARNSLAQLYLLSASADLKAYQAGAGGGTPLWDKLLDARTLVNQAHQAAPQLAAVADMDHQVHAEVLALCARAEEHLESYRLALKNNKPGYGDLTAAESLAQAAVSVEPSTAEAARAMQNARAERAAFDKILRDADSQLAAHNPDEASRAIVPLRAFASENARIADDIKAISTLYLLHARELQSANHWAEAVAELQKAEAIQPSRSTEALLNTARQQATIAADKAAAGAAVQKSEDLEASGDILGAFQTVDDLPPAQRTIASDRLQALKDRYVPAADDRAKALQKAHEPIGGIGDEMAFLEAYGYLQRCYRLTNDPTYQDRLDALGDELSAWYLQQGRKYYVKPEGSGVNVAWMYLTEALQYNSPTNSGPVRDLMTTAGSAHRLKSRLSIKVDFRDQTSRRDAPQFSNQLSDAIASGLDASGLMVAVIRPGDTTAVQPNFQLIGDVLLHEMRESQDNKSRESMYRSGEHEVPNDAWNAANRDYVKASLELETARSIQQGAEARGKKKEIEDARKAVADVQAKVERFRDKLDSIPRTESQPIERSYTYIEVVHHIDPVVELQFRILDSAGEEIVPPMKVHRELPKEYTVLENVKAEDTRGVRAEGTIPDVKDFYRETETRAIDELISAARQKVAQLPAYILQVADRKAAQNDQDGAAELYILYLNSTKEEDTPERQRIRKYLLQSFNFRAASTEAPSA